MAAASSSHVTVPTGAPGRGSLGSLALGAVGIVFGDIGTSPLYTMSTAFDPANGLTPDAASVTGVVSLILWSLIVIVSLKYVALIMRAHNHGEGGIMALLALAVSSLGDRTKLRQRLLLLGVFGAALFYGDSVITPAISVLSAVEGLEVVTPTLKPYVVPITATVLVVLFLMQRRGTAGIGAVFGPVMVLWFVTQGVVGLVNLPRAPEVLYALNPFAGLLFLAHHPWLGFVALGSVVLALTGAEALYADMGHFGANPVRLSWFALVFPSLLFTYLGQGALLLSDAKAIANPFFNMFPSWAVLPAIVLATVATVIASQAVISGAYSMTKQAIQLGFLPRMTVLQTSDREIGQVYVPLINWLLLAAVLGSVLGFRASTALGSAYGIAVTGTMLSTTFLTFFVIRYAWGLNWVLCVLATCFFFVIDATFLASNLLKLVEGGWYPLAIGALVFLVMTTWGRGREIMIDEARNRAGSTPLRQYLDDLFGAEPPQRASGTAVFLTIAPDAVPHALINNLTYNGVLHERVIFANVQVREVPSVDDAERIQIMPLGHDCYCVVIAYGFKDEIDVPRALELGSLHGLPIDSQHVAYFLSHANVVATGRKGMSIWRERLFAAMSQNLGNPAAFLKLPASRVIELGARVEI